MQPRLESLQNRMIRPGPIAVIIAFGLILSFSFFIPVGPVSGDIQEISRTAYCKIFSSDNNSTDPVIVLTAPSGGENWTAGNEYSIDWYTYGGMPPLSVFIEYKIDSGSYHIIKKNLNGNGPVTWTTPFVTTFDCYVRAVVNDSSIPMKSNYSISDKFTVWQSAENESVITHLSLTPGSQAMQVGTSLLFTVQAYDQNWNPVPAICTWQENDPSLGTIAQNDQTSARFIAKNPNTGSISVQATYNGRTLASTAKIRVLQATPVLDSVSIAPIYWIGNVGAKKEFTAHGWNGSYEVVLDYCVWSVSPKNLGSFSSTSDYSVIMTATGGGTGHIYVKGDYNGTERQGSADIHIDEVGSSTVFTISIEQLLFFGGILLIIIVVALLIYVVVRKRRQREKEKMLKEWSSALTVMKRRKCPKCNTFIPVGMSMCPVCITTPAKRVTIIDEIFLLYNDGRLIKHHTRRLRPTVDERIFSSMLVAVQDFVKDSYGYEAGSLDELKFGDYRILLGRGRYIIIATIVSGDDFEPVKKQIRKAINELENAYQDALINWDGNMDALAGINKFIEYLLIGSYQ